MIKNKKLLIGYKIFFALLGFAAIVTEVAVTLERGGFDAVNFFSYFTVQVNIIVIVTLLLSAVSTASGKVRAWLEMLRAAAVVYILVVGIGFAALLAGLEGVSFTAVPWDNIVLHYIMPVALLVDYIFDRPKIAGHFKKNLSWIAYPVVYICYSLVRGEVVGWYPYPFLNASVAGVGSTITAVVGLLLLGVTLIWIITRTSVRSANRVV